MKAPVLSAVLSILLLIAPSHGSAQDWSLPLSRTKNAVVKVEIQVGDEHGHCSGVIIADELVLTAGHCIPDNTSRSFAVGGRHAELVRANAILDLAVLHVSDLTGQALTVRHDTVNPGTPVAVIGFGFAADRLKYGFGWVSDERDNSLRAIGDRLYFSASGVVPGDSGGAVVDSADRLCGIVLGVVFAGPSSLAYGAPAPVIEDFIKPILKAAKKP